MFGMEPFKMDTYYSRFLVLERSSVDFYCGKCMMNEYIHLALNTEFGLEVMF